MSWWSVILIIVGAYALICAAIYFLQELFIFHPERLTENFTYNFEYPFDEIWLETEGKAKINGIHFKIPNAKGVVFYFKGNSRSIKGWSKFARDFLGKGYDIFMIDYRGFGKSKGKRTEEAIYSDSQLAYNYLKNLYPEEQITIYGRSIGSGFATRIAANNHPNKLILDSPYYSFLELGQRFLPIFPLKYLLKYHIRTDLYIKDVNCPVYILHGTKDRLIPIRSGIRLAQKAKMGVIIPIEDAHHNNLPRFAAYHDHLYAILHGITRTYSYNGGMQTSYN